MIQPLQKIILLIFLLQSLINIDLKAADGEIAISDSILIPLKEQGVDLKQLEFQTKSLETSLVYPKPPKKYVQVYPLPHRDFKRLSINTGMFLGTTVLSFGILYALPESATQWDKEKMREEGITKKWEANIHKGPVIDNDNFFFNYVTHPWAGAGYYMTARSSGFKWWDSFLYSSVMSTLFWEYGVEAFAEIPSVQDIFITPIVGSMFGEGFFYAKKSIMKHDKRIMKSKVLGVTALFLMDPFNTILDGIGYQDKYTTTVTIAPVGLNPLQQTPVWGANIAIRF